MKRIKKYCDKQKKIVEKIIKRMFGYTYVDAIKDEEIIRLELEKEFSKNIENLTWTDISKSSMAPKKYAKYKTLKALIDTYLNIQRVYMFSNDYEGEING